MEVWVNGVAKGRTAEADPSAAWPIGSVFTSLVAANPTALLGFGTWVALGAGRVLVGLDAAQDEFNTLRGTGGAKTHTLTVAEMPSHTHIQNTHSHTRPTASTVGTSTAQVARGSTTAAGTVTVADPVAAVNQNTGGGGAHNNLQPYLVVRFWERTA